MNSVKKISKKVIYIESVLGYTENNRRNTTDSSSEKARLIKYFLPFRNLSRF